MNSIPTSILDLSKWPYFPSILGLQICPRCKYPSLLAQFWRKNSWCKHCERCRKINYNKEKKAAYQKRPEQRKYFAAWMRKNRQTAKGKERNAYYNETYRERWPGRQKARLTLYNAIRSGHIIRQPCIICGTAKAEAHHPDYSKALEVIWLCMPCHKELHHTSHKLTTEQLAKVNTLLHTQQFTARPQGANKRPSGDEIKTPPSWN